ncbi:serine hydrolase domain-containing protein [Agarilytica rhodophyticola]|uniref:serine hydrolase domain-containing protein n=1 Tax=Agarilytica rhodophyticola TaxID=1737490 RepID=UPI000B3481B1|nr:serine hydrolase domain-containing protein [Agarilytica rhodophyticola]
MKLSITHLRFIAFVIFLACLQTNGQENVKAVTSEQSQYEKELSKLLDSLSNVTKVPSFSVSVVHKGRLVASASTGYTDVENGVHTTNESIFRLASVSKIVGASMLAELVIAGKLNPDAHIGNYVPNLDERYHQITIRQLLSHTSGMPHYQIKDYDIDNKHYQSAQEALETLKGRSLLSYPGDKYHYSTHGYTLAGVIYELVSKRALSKSLPDFIRRWTGKKTPVIEDIRNLHPNTSNLYSLSFGGVEKIAFSEKSYSIFGAGLSATASELAYFGYEVLNKSRSNTDYEKLLFSPSLTNNGRAVATSTFHVGFGWRIGHDEQGRKVYHHAGATPGARSILVLYPDEDLAISILSNARWISSIDKMAFALVDLYLNNVKPNALKPGTTYTATFGTATVTGKISCNNATCYLKNENTPYTRWLNTFNSTGNHTDDWPIFSYSSKHGDRLLMVSKIGIRSFVGNRGYYQANVREDKTYSLKISF